MNITSNCSRPKYAFYLPLNVRQSSIYPTVHNIFLRMVIHARHIYEVCTILSYFLFYLVKVQIPSIMKYPNRSRYSEEIEVIILTCLSNGNPSPTYSWYFNQTVIQAGSVFEIKNGRESDSGLYICNASNSFHGTKFEASNTVDIQIISKCHIV